MTDTNSPAGGRHGFRIANRRIPLPPRRWQRVTLGLLLLLGGCLWFLPIVGLWMLPAGMLVLSVDMPAARRLRRRVEVWWGRRRRRKATADPQGGPVAH